VKRLLGRNDAPTAVGGFQPPPATTALRSMIGPFGLVAGTRDSLTRILEDICTMSYASACITNGSHGLAELACRRLHEPSRPCPPQCFEIVYHFLRPPVAVPKYLQTRMASLRGRLSELLDDSGSQPLGALNPTKKNIISQIMSHFQVWGVENHMTEVCLSQRGCREVDIGLVTSPVCGTFAKVGQGTERVPDS
jgi:hypothetical protein